MKERIALWLVGIAKRLCPQKEFSLAEAHEPKKLGIGYHITKKDVREYRKHNPQFKSHRQALNALVEDTRKEIGMNIFAAVYKNNLIDYTVHKTPYVADVTGALYVYASKKEADSTEKRKPEA